eukprot:tig00000989_g6098.t1
MNRGRASEDDSLRGGGLRGARDCDIEEVALAVETPPRGCGADLEGPPPPWRKLLPHLGKRTVQSRGGRIIVGFFALVFLHWLVTDLYVFPLPSIKWEHSVGRGMHIEPYRRVWSREEDVAHRVTLVSAMIDIGRDKWVKISRSKDKYARNLRRMCSMRNPLVIFIEPGMRPIVEDERAKHGLLDKTLIFDLTLETLPAGRYIPDAERIMKSDDYAQRRGSQKWPEYMYPLYNIVMWSKIGWMKNATDTNPFNTDYFIWIDAGIHTGMLLTKHLGRPIPVWGGPDARLFQMPKTSVRFMATDIPQWKDLDFRSFTMAHVNRFAGTMFGGHKNAIQWLYERCEEVYEEWISMNVVDQDQTVFSTLYLKYPHNFDIFVGWWPRVVEDF